MTSILFLGCVYSETQKDLFLKKSRRGYQFAAQNLQESLIEGFVANETDFTVLTIPSLSTFPRGCLLPVVRDTDFVMNGKTMGKSLGYLNVPFKNHVDYSEAAEYIDLWYNKTNGKHVIFVYALLGQQMGIALAAKRRHSDIKLCVIVPDLPRFMGGNKYYNILGLQEKSINSIYARIQRFDGLVVLAEPMVADLGMTGKPYIVVEGVCSDVVCIPLVEKDKNIAVLYTGGMVIRYGVKDLVDAFMKIKDDNYRLWLCGTGDAVSYIKECAKRDSRIVYKGLVPKTEAVELQQKATILVNPRHSSEEYTKYSFPSKTIEYMVSGTPTLMSRLPSIPSDYYEHLFFFDDESVDGMAATIKKVGDMDKDVLRQKGEAAASFIRKNKNSKSQVGRIVDLLTSI